MKTDENRIEDSMALNIVEIVVRLRITPASGALWAHPLVSQKKKKNPKWSIQVVLYLRVCMYMCMYIRVYTLCV